MLGSGLGIGGYKTFEPGDASNLVLWLKNYVDVAVDQWSDQSGNDNHATQSVKQAAVSEGGLDFEQAEGDHYNLASRITLSHDVGFTLGLVLKVESYDGTQNCFLSDSSTEFFEFQTSGKIRLRTIGTGAATSVLTYSGTPFAAGSKMALVLTRAAGAASGGAEGLMTAYKDGVALSTSSASNNPNSGQAQIDMLGARAASTADRFFDGVIYEVVVYQKELTGSELTNLNEYLTAIKSL